jgi:hypothetical protein
MREVCFVLTGERILRVYVGTPTRVPDSRERWEIIWKHRDEITEMSTPIQAVSWRFREKT